MHQRTLFQRLLTVGLWAALLINLGAPRPVLADQPAAANAAVTLSGVVKDGTPGGHTFPVYARIDFTAPSLPLVSAFSDPFTGAYSVSLQPSTVYTATVYPLAVGGFAPLSAPVTTGSGPTSQDFKLIAALPGCNAPGYKAIASFSENFDSATPPALPAGWDVVSYGSISGATWATHAGARAWNAAPPAYSLPNVVYFNSFSAAAGAQSGLRHTSTIDLTGGSTAQVTFEMYQGSSYTNADNVEVAVSTDNTHYYLTGDIFERYSSTPGWYLKTTNISGYAGAGKPPVWILFLGTSQYGDDISLDDIRVTPVTCDVVPGAMAAGLTSNLQSSAPIISAIVSNKSFPADQAASISTPGDPAYPNGIYEFFTTHTGSQTLDATAMRYSTQSRTLPITAEAVNRVDFHLPSAWLTASPAPIRLTIVQGQFVDTTLTIQNSGPLPANFTLQSAQTALTSGSTQSLQPDYPPMEAPSHDPADLAPEGALVQMVNGPTGGGPLRYGVTTPFPGTAVYRYGAASCDARRVYLFGGFDQNSVATAETWMYDSAADSWTALPNMPNALGNLSAACIDGKIYLVGGYSGGVYTNHFMVYDTVSNTWPVNSTVPFTSPAMSAAYLGKLYVFGVNNGSAVYKLSYVYNPLSFAWAQIADMPTPTLYGGITVSGAFIYIIGGASTSDIQRYDPAQNTWSNNGPDLTDARMNPVVAWYGSSIYILGGGVPWTPDNDGYSFDPSAWPGGSLVPITGPVPQAVMAAGGACASNHIWMVGGVRDLITYTHNNQYYDEGLMCQHTYTPAGGVTILSGPSGTVPAGGNVSLTIRADASDPSLSTPGAYNSVLKFNSDAPQTLADIPVQISVVAKAAFMDVTPAFTTRLGHPNQVVQFVFTVKNNGGMTENFIPSLITGSQWPSVIKSSSLTGILPGATGTVTVEVTIPAAVKPGDFSDFNLKVTSDACPLCFNTAGGQTTALYYHVMVPLVMK